MQQEEPDYDMIFFAGEKKLKFSLKIDDIITEMVLSGDDIDARWNTFLSENQNTVQAVEDEMNAGIAR